jgi:hypothetical protein
MSGAKPPSTGEPSVHAAAGFVRFEMKCDGIALRTIADSRTTLVQAGDYGCGRVARPRGRNPPLPWHNGCVEERRHALGADPATGWEALRAWGEGPVPVVGEPFGGRTATSLPSPQS